MKEIRHIAAIAIFAVITAGLNAQKVGIETTTPDSTLSISNKLEIGGTQGDLLFTDDLGSITFPVSALPNSPMINMFASGTSNADRMVLAHSPTHNDWGLLYRDASDEFSFVGNGQDVLSMNLASRYIAIGSALLDPNYTVNVGTSTQQSAGYFLNERFTSLSSYGLWGRTSGAGSGWKYGGFFESTNGSGTNFGVYGTAVAGATNVGVYGNALAGAVNRAAWFDAGDVIVDDQMLIGSNSSSDTPHSSAMLELKSTTRGLLLPRMSQTQRTSIGSPAEGLVVYDTTNDDVYVKDGGGWKTLGGDSFWDENAIGIHHDGTNVVIGDNQGTFFEQLYVTTDNKTYSGRFINENNTGGSKYGVLGNVSFHGTGTRIGIYGVAQGPESGSAAAYGVRGEATGGGATTLYGVYGSVLGLTTGEKWAGYFAGKVEVEEHFKVIDGSEASLTSDGFLQTGETTGPNLVMDNNEITARNNGATSALYLNPNQGNVVVGHTTDAGAKFFVDSDPGQSVVRFRRSGSTKFHIDSTGAVMINTVTNKKAGYELNVDGQIVAEEVLVQNSSNWPDFVFADDYQLPTLEEVENHITVHRHLPGVPSASEIEEDGILLGEMDKTLMQKVEELTLYMIEQSKEIKHLRQENEELRQFVTESLKKRDQ